MKRRLAQIILGLMISRGKSRHVFACLFGVFATLALPPVYIIPLLFVGVSGLLLLIMTSKSKRQAFLSGWWFGFGHFVTGLYWIAYALLTDAEQFGWMVPFAVLGIAGVLAIYCALVSWATYVAPVKAPLSKIILFSVFWSLGEYARTYLFSGFPWNLIGYVWTFSDAMIQPASLIGTYGLGFITILAAGSFAALVYSLPYEKKAIKGSRAFVLIMIMVLAVSWGWGSSRLSQADDGVVEGVKLRIVQGNIKQSFKWEPGQRDLNLKKYIDLTRGEGFDDITYVIWPETAVPYVIREENPELMPILQHAAPPKGVLLTGAMRLEGQGSDYDIWNSFFVITPEAGVHSFYDKFHLVPFGEYLPFRSWLPSFINKITLGAKDFSTGNGPKPLALPNGTTVLPLICYEAIFPQYAHQNGVGDFSWILNITNDAWFGVSSGPYQHLNMVKMRAVEQGVPVIRAANTGVSVVIDAYGRVSSSLSLNTTGVLDSGLPKKITDKTLYNYMLSYIIHFIVVLGGVLITLTEKIHKNTGDYS